MSCNEEKNKTQIHYNCQKCMSHNRQNNSTFMRCTAILTRKLVGVVTKMICKKHHFSAGLFLERRIRLV